MEYYRSQVLICTSTIGSKWHMPMQPICVSATCISFLSASSSINAVSTPRAGAA